MYLLFKIGDQRSYRNGDINFNINSYMDTLEKDELTTSTHVIGKFLKSGIPNYDSEVSYLAGKNTRRRITQATVKRSAFHKNAITLR